MAIAVMAWVGGDEISVKITKGRPLWLVVGRLETYMAD